MLVVALLLNSLFRGIWLPMGLVCALAFAFAWHPRFVSPAEWLLSGFGYVALGLWGLNVGTSPVRLFQLLADLLPALMFVLGALCLVIFYVRNKISTLPLPTVPCALFLLLGWLIVFFSGGAGGAEPMRLFFLDWLGLSAQASEIVVIGIRKAIHFLFYGLLAYNAFRLAGPDSNLRKAVIFGLAISLAFAIFDEFHQLSADNRSSSTWDIGLDMLGSTTFLGLSVLRYRKSHSMSNAGRLPEQSEMT